MSMADSYYSVVSRAPWPVDPLRSSSGAFLLPASAQKITLLPSGLLGRGQAIGESEYRTSSMVEVPRPQAEEKAQNSVASINEAKLLNDVVRARVRFPQDVLRVEFRFGEDSANAPAVW